LIQTFLFSASGGKQVITISRALYRELVARGYPHSSH
jgi:hypothetical protein